MLCRRSWSWALAAVLVGCSPALNWREVRIGTAPLRLLLPCKPDRAERDVVMGGVELPLLMLGCAADGVTFAVSHVRAPDAAAAQALLEGWKRVVLLHLQAHDVAEQAWIPAGAWQMPQSVRLLALGRGTDGRTVMLQAAWFGVIDAAGVHLFHAIVLSPRPRPEAADAFLAGLSPGS